MTKIERETMTSRKLWCRALFGGLLAQFDLLACTMVAGGNAQSTDSDVGGISEGKK